MQKRKGTLETLLMFAFWAGIILFLWDLPMPIYSKWGLGLMLAILSMWMTSFYYYIG